MKLFGFIVQDVSQKKEFNEKISVKVNKGEKKNKIKICVLRSFSLFFFMVEFWAGGGGGAEGNLRGGGVIRQNRHEQEGGSRGDAKHDPDGVPSKEWIKVTFYFFHITYQI